MEGDDLGSGALTEGLAGAPIYFLLLQDEWETVWLGLKDGQILPVLQAGGLWKLKGRGFRTGFLALWFGKVLDLAARGKKRASK